MSLTSELVSYIIGSRYEDLPKVAVENTKKYVLDTLGVIIAGSSADGIERLVKLVKGWGGRTESTIAVYGDKVPAPNAALVNCTMGRACEFETINDLVSNHPHATIVPSLFIISEYSKMFRGRVINGKDFILGVTLGADIHYRIRLAGGMANLRRGFTTNTVDPIVVAAMGAKILGFDETKMLNAMGIAYAQCATNVQAYLEGALMVRLQGGFGGKAGVLSIVLADEGFTGAKDMLEGKYGYYPVYMPGECSPDERAVLTAGLGKRFEDSDVSIKPYPCCRSTHGPIEGALQLVKEHNIKADNIKQVTIYTRLQAYEVCGGERKVAPQAVPEAEFSFYYTVATALVKGRVFIEHFTEQAIRDPEVLAMARKVKAVVDPEKEKSPATQCPIDIDIETKDGKHYKKTVEFAKGNPKNPMTMAEVSQKLRDCVKFSAKPLPSQNIDKIIQMAEDLDKLNDVTVILECLK